MGPFDIARYGWERAERGVDGAFEKDSFFFLKKRGKRQARYIGQSDPSDLYGRR